MNESSADLAWHGIDLGRLRHESRLLSSPWALETEPDGRLAWSGGTVGSKWRGRQIPDATARFIYPVGYPARFIEARLDSEISPELSGVLGAHVNADGSACYIAGNAWRPQDTVAEALQLLEVWWWNFYWLQVKKLDHPWPTSGRVDV